MATKRAKPDPDDPMQQAIQAVVDQIMTSDNPQAAFTAFTGDLMARAGAPGPFLSPANTPIILPEPPKNPRVLTVRVDIDGAKPPIWRRLDIRGELNLGAVHDVMQAAFGWMDGHLHRFGGPGVGAWEMPYFITEYDEDEDDEGTFEEEARLDQVLRKPGEKLT